MARYRQACITHIDESSKYGRFFAVFLLFSCSFSSLYATEDLYPTSPLAHVHTAFPSAFFSRVPEHEGTLTREFAAGDIGKVWLVYSERDHKISGFVANKEGHVVTVKSHDMPRELAQIRNTALFEAFCQNTYAHTRFLSNGDMSFSLHPRGLGGGKLHEAAERGDIESLNTLLENPDARSQMNDKNNQGLSPLHCAIASRNLEAVRLLLDAGANIYQAGAMGMTALHLSAQIQEKNICQLLLSRGAHLDVEDDQGRTALDLASEVNAVEIRQLLEEYANRETDPLLAINLADAQHKKYKKIAYAGGVVTAACLTAIGIPCLVVFVPRKTTPLIPLKICAAQVSLASLNGINGFTLNGVATGDQTGNSVSSAGDINGDKIADLIISALSPGNTYVVFGHNGSWPPTISLTNLNGQNGFSLQGVQRNSYTAQSVSGMGDVNGDGMSDVIIGAPNADTNSGADSGASYVVFGRNGTWPFSMLLSSLNGANGFNVTGSTAGSNVGNAVSGAGDINNDGIDDIIIGAPGANDYTGASYVIFGYSGVWPSTIPLNSLNGMNGFNITGFAPNSDTGLSVSGAGDINDDSIDDIIISAPDANSKTGGGYVVFGRKGPWPSTISLSTLNGTTGFNFTGITSGYATGWSVNSAGDVNNDSISDVIIGAPGNFQGEGASYIVFGHKGIWDASIFLNNLNGTNGFTLIAGGGSGREVNTAGDVNGDGIDDVIIGAPNIDNTGASYVVFGHEGAWNARLLLSNLNGKDGFNVTDVAAGSQLGSSVSTAGDFNNDGINDIIIGAPNANTTAGVNSGASYVVFGQRSCELTSSWPELPERTQEAEFTLKISTDPLLHETTISSSTRLDPFWLKPLTTAFQTIRAGFSSFFSAEWRFPTDLQKSLNAYGQALNLFKNSDTKLKESHWLDSHVKLGILRGKLKARHLEGHFVHAPLLMTPSLPKPLSSYDNLAVPLNISLPVLSNPLRIWG